MLTVILKSANTSKFKTLFKAFDSFKAKNLKKLHFFFLVKIKNSFAHFGKIQKQILISNVKFSN